MLHKSCSHNSAQHIQMLHDTNFMLAQLCSSRSDASQCMLVCSNTHVPNLLHALVHVHARSQDMLQQHAQKTCSCITFHSSLMGSRFSGVWGMSCSRHQEFTHAQIPNAQNENLVLEGLVEATAMMHHTQLALQDVYNHHCRYVNSASGVDFTTIGQCLRWQETDQGAPAPC